MPESFLKKLQEWLTTSKIEYKKDIQIKFNSWIKAGGVIKTYITPKNIKECANLLKYLKNENINFYVLGNQSNTIIRDGFIFTPIINLKNINNFNFFDKKNGLKIEVGSGISIPRFSKSLSKKGYTGTEGLLGIPGSIGGGICMNSSSYESYLSKYLVNVNLMDVEGNIFNLKKEELEFGWRKSLVKEEKLIILNCEFYFPKVNYIGENKTKEISLNIMNHRKLFQENNLPNLGSIFATKNIYKDLSKLSFTFLILYYFYKIGSVFYFNFNTKKVSRFRSFIILIYLKLLGLEKFYNFSSSSKTLNCLVNNGTTSTSNGINFLKKFNEKTGKYLKIENIILDDIY